MTSRAHVLIRLKLDGWRHEPHPHPHKIGKQHVDGDHIRMVKDEAVKYITADGYVHDYARSLSEHYAVE